MSRSIVIREIGLSQEIGNEISKSRIEFLTDGIFAIVMTLLVLEIDSSSTANSFRSGS